MQCTLHVMTMCTLSMIHFTKKILPCDYKIKAHMLMEMRIIENIQHQ